MPHAWLIAGPQGIGKATLAYRMTRFVLAHPHPEASEVQRAENLYVDQDNPAARRIASQAHSDLLVFERTIGETGKLRTQIVVDQIRRAVQFFGSTAGEGGWRICILDSAEDLNREGANALLKILEEPPPRSLLLVVSHAPGRLLPTIRSRCRRLMLHPLADTDVIRAASEALGVEQGDVDLRAAAAQAGGNVAKAIALRDAEALALRKRLDGLLEALPQTDQRALHAIGDMIARDEEAHATFVDTVEGWIASRLAQFKNTQQLARIAEAGTTFGKAVSEADEYNLDRKPLVFSAFSLLAEAQRG
jgi:DNA polymerase-3 subunit delta'